MAGKPAVENKVSLPLDALEVTQPLNSQGLSHAQPKSRTNASLVLEVAFVVVVVPDNHSLTNDLLWLVVVIGHDILGVAVVIHHYTLNDTLFLDLLHLLHPLSLVVSKSGSDGRNRKQEKEILHGDHQPFLDRRGVGRTLHAYLDEAAHSRRTSTSSSTSGLLPCGMFPVRVAL